jgi:hypothetical protein
MKTRQKIRTGTILLSFFLFPVTFYYLSPGLIVEAAIKAIVNGSFIMFGLLFVSSLFLDRAYCRWMPVWFLAAQVLRMKNFLFLKSS